MKMLGYAWRWLSSGCKTRGASGYGYSKDSFLRAAPILIAFAFPPEVLLEQLLIPKHFWILKLALNGVELFFCLWVIGYAASLAERPHRIEGPTLRLRNGALREMLIEIRNISSAHNRGRFDRAELRKIASRPERAFVIDGAPIVELNFNEAVVLGRTAVQRILVSVDDPAGFCAALQTPRVG